MGCGENQGYNPDGEPMRKPRWPLPQYFSIGFRLDGTFVGIRIAAGSLQLGVSEGSRGDESALPLTLSFNRSARPSSAIYMLVLPVEFAWDFGLAGMCCSPESRRVLSPNLLLMCPEW